MDQKNVFILIGVAVAIFLFAAVFFKGSNITKYRLRTFLTKNEKDCFKHLQRIFPEYHICPQVSMGALLEPLAKMSSANAKERSNNAIHRNQISSKVIDFIMLDKNLEPAFIIELDDNTHNSKQDKDRERDIHILKAGLKTVRIRRVKGAFPTRQQFENILGSQN
jgi:Protein of unknown function (DUF2726)